MTGRPGDLEEVDVLDGDEVAGFVQRSCSVTLYSIATAPYYCHREIYTDVKSCRLCQDGR